MDLESRSVNMQLNYDKFTMDTSVTLEKQFFQHSNFYVAAAFLCNLEEEAAFDRDLVFDKKSLLAPISAEDVYAVVKLCPYFVIAEGKIGIELLVRKSIVRQGFDCGGRLTVFLDRTEVTNKSKEGLLELNNTLLSKERFFELDVVKPDSDFVIAILDAIATNTDGLEKTSEKSYQMSENFVAKLLALGEAFSNKRSASPYIEREAEVEGRDSGDELISEKKTVDLTEWKDDSPEIDSSASSHRALDASRRKRARKTEAATASAEEENEGKEGDDDPEVARRRELLQKLREAKQESKAIESGNFTCRRVRCPLCHSQMSASTNEDGETYLWCPNKCALPYKPNNEKARYLGELSARINPKFVNPNRPPDCKHGENRRSHPPEWRKDQDRAEEHSILYLSQKSSGRTV
ncbi:hypothetical protein OS493_032777 [Desmophyllum pertusum]|uniref:Uncharacterized protein n=1 Tax=Desmophyllum pertusum TaxID=174260 RepID=A0A9W9ZJC7_9CNID|nr:hypothetical protein OS493_032777 [Desmophyllum pertusum]